MRTFLDSMNNIEAMRPSSTEFTFAQRGKWFYDLAFKHYKDFGILKSADLLLTTSTDVFDITSASTQIALENITKLYVTCTNTTCSSNIEIDTKFDEYEITSIMDPVNPNYVKFSKPFPDQRMLRVFFVAIPALMPATSSDSTTIVDIDQAALNALEYGVMARICKSGDAPDVDLANAYEQDYREEVRRVKVLVRNRSRKMKNDPVSYKEWEW